MPADQDRLKKTGYRNQENMADGRDQRAATVRLTANI